MWVYSSHPPAPSVTLHRLLTASAHCCISVVECIVRVYFVLIYSLLVTFISINAIVLYYFVDSYMELLGIPAMMAQVVVD